MSSNPLSKGKNMMSDVDGKQLNKGHSNVCEKGELDYNGDKYRP